MLWFPLGRTREPSFAIETEYGTMLNCDRELIAIYAAIGGFRDGAAYRIRPMTDDEIEYVKREEACATSLV